MDIFNTLDFSITNCDISDIISESNRFLFFEPWYTMTLSTFVANGLCNSVAIKVLLLEDILWGLAALHNMSHPGFSYKDSQGVSQQTGFFRLFHFDLKPARTVGISSGLKLFVRQSNANPK